MSFKSVFLILEMVEAILSTDDSVVDYLHIVADTESVCVVCGATLSDYKVSLSKMLLQNRVHSIISDWSITERVVVIRAR